jgi:DNA-binding beta-propeller fold protein YncE
MKHASGWTLARIGKTVLTLIAAAIGAAVLMNSSCNLTNKAPTVPVITGPSSGVVGVAVTFKATATDPDNDSIAFQFDWGDSSAPAWTNLIASGETLFLAHTYSDSGTLLVKAKAKDAKGKESTLSESIAVAILAPGPSYPDSNMGMISTIDASKWAVVSPDGKYLYAANLEHDSITAIRLSDRAVLPPVDVGGPVSDLAISPDGSRLYVGRVDGYVVALNLPDMTVDTVVHPCSRAYGITTTKDGRFVLVCARDDQNLLILSSTDLSTVKSVALGDKPSYVAASPDGHTAYVELDYHCFAVVDVDSGRFVKYLTDLGRPGRMAMTSDGSRLYVLDVEIHGIRVVSLPGGTEVGRIEIGDIQKKDIVLSPDGNLVIVSYYYGLKYFDTRTFAAVCSLPCGVLAALAARPQFDTLYAVEHARTFVIGRR